jgi:hypothetical protein
MAKIVFDTSSDEVDKKSPKARPSILARIPWSDCDLGGINMALDLYVFEMINASTEVNIAAISTFRIKIFLYDHNSLVYCTVIN